LPESVIRIRGDASQLTQELRKASASFGEFANSTDKFGKAIAGAFNPRTDSMTKYLSDMRNRIQEVTQSSLSLATTAGGKMTNSMRAFTDEAYRTIIAVDKLSTGWRNLPASQKAAEIGGMVSQLNALQDKMKRAQWGSASVTDKLFGSPADIAAINNLLKSMTTNLQAVANAGQNAVSKVAPLTSVTHKTPAGASNNWYSDKTLDQYYAKQSSTASGGSAYSDTAIRERQNAIKNGIQGIGDAADTAGAKIAKMTSAMVKVPKGASNDWGSDDFLSKFRPKGSTTTAGGAAYDDAKIREAQAGMAKLAEETKKVGDAAKKSKDSSSHLLDTFGKIAKYTIGYKLIDMFLGLPQQIVQTAAAMEQLRAGFEGVFGKKAAAEFQYVVDMSNKYGKALDQVAPSYQKFAASTDYLGISGDQSKRIFETVTQTITKIGGSSEDVRGTLTAMQQMLSKGTVMSEEFRLQFAERIPGAMKMGANAMGTTVEGFKKMMENGGVLASEFLPKLVTEMERFSTGWEKSADTLNANWTRLNNAFQVYVADNSSGLTKMLNDTVKWATESLNWYNKVSKDRDTDSRYSWYQNKGFEGFEGTSDIKTMKERLDAYEGMDIPGQIARIESALAKANDRGDMYGNTVSGDAQLERLLEYKKQALYVQDTLKAIDGVKSKLSSGIISGEATSQANNWLKEAADSIEKLHQPRPDINFRPHVDVSEIVGAINLINQLYQKTKDFQVEAASTSLEAVERSTKKVEEFVQENQKVAQASAGSSNFLMSDQAYTNISTGTEALKKQSSVVKGLKKDLQDKTIALAKDGEAQRQYELDRSIVKGKDKESQKSLKRSEAAADLEFLQNLKKAAVELGDKAPYSVEVLDKAIVDLGKNTKTALDAIDKSGGGAANAAERLVTKVDSLAWRMKKFNAESRGDSMTAGLMGIEEEYTNKMAELDRLGKKSGKGSDREREVAEATKVAQQTKVTAENYEKAQNSLSSMLSTYAQLTDNPALKREADFLKAEIEYGAKKQQDIQSSIKSQEDMLAGKVEGVKLEGEARTNAEAYLEVMKRLLALQPGLLEASKKRSEYEAQIAELGQKQRYAELTGDTRGALAAQIEMKQRELEISLKSTENLYKSKALQEEISQLQAKKDLNVSKLTSMGLAKAADKAYTDLADKIENAIPAALDSLGEAMSSNLGDMISGAQTAEQAFQNMGKQMRASIMQLIIDLGMAIVKMQALKWLAGSTTDVDVNVPGVSGTQPGQSSSGGLTGSMKDIAGSYLKDKITSGIGDKLGIGNMMDGLDTFGFTNMGMGSLTGGYTSSALSAGSSAFSNTMATTSLTGTQALGAADAAAVSSMGAAQGSTSTAASITGGLGSTLGSAAAGIGIGGSLGSMIWSNGTGTAGAWGGAVGGAAIGTAIFPGVGTLIGGIIGGLAGGGLSGKETTTTSKTGGQGITVNMTMAGKHGIMGYDEYRQTKSGAFGSESTTHFKGYKVADPELARKWNEGMLQVNNTLERSLKTLNIGLEPLKNFTFPIEFDVNLENMDAAIYNISNAMAENVITAKGLKQEFDDTAKEGEMYIDQIKRISEAYSSIVVVSEIAGASLEKLSQSVSKIIQGDYASQLIDQLGSADAVNAAFTRIQKHSGKSPAEQAQSQMMVYGKIAGEQLAYLEDQTVNFSNFWSKFAAAREGGMSASKFKEWSDAASAVDAFEQSFFQAENVRVSLLQEELTVMQESAYALEEVVSKWGDLVDALKSAREDLLFDKNLSSLTPEEVYNQKKSKFADLKGRAQSGDQEAIAELASFSKDFVEESRSYYGASTAYYDDFNMVTDTLGSTLSIAEQQLSVAQAQLTALNTQITLHQQTILELQNMANGLFTVGAGMDAIAAKMGLNTGAAAAIQTANEAQVAAYAALAFVAPQNNSAPAWTPPADTTGSIPDWLYGGQSPNAYASGGGFGPGLALVGEDGPEFVRFKTSGTVFSNKKSGLDMPSLSSGLDAIAQTTAAGAMSTTNEVAQLRSEVRMLTKAIRRMAEAR
jgi:tape measure domain-containing protein